MSMLYNQIKFEINTNNDELSGTIWVNMKKIKREEKVGILLNQ
jgi:hypothetical protein